MSVSKIQPQGGANDFTLDIGSSGNTTFILNKEYSPGAYSITSQLSDSTLDIYAFNGDGSLSGYTNNKAFTATKGFVKLVVLGSTSNDLLSFTYKTTYSPVSIGTDVTAGPYLTSASKSSLPNKDDSVTIIGGNFATDVSISFVGSNGVSIPAKSVNRISSTQLSAVRPDIMPPSNNPYTIVATNPGVPNPSGTSLNKLINVVGAGSSPVWVTAEQLPIFTKNSAYSTTIVATDSDGGSSVSYSLISGSFPTGISLASNTGIISGTPTSSINTSVTIRATDSGGNYIDRVFILTDAAPTWSTGSVLPSFSKNVSYSQQLSAIDDSGQAPTYSIVAGTLPSGLTLSSSGLLAGIPTVSTSSTITVRATDSNGNYSDKTITIPDTAPVWTTTSPLSPYTTNVAYSQQLVASDDSGLPVTYSIASGALPTGLSLSASGLISGTSSAGVGNYSITVRATDENGLFTDRTFSMAGGSSAFSYTGAVQTFTAPLSGTYALEVWGAQGGNNSPQTGGLGGYSYGRVSLASGATLSVYVGGQSTGGGSGSAGWNGAGYGSNTGGGGATDIRQGGTALSNRIIVAGGGGGAYSGGGNGGAGGGLTGGDGWVNNGSNAGKGATQSAGGAEGGSLGQGGSNTYGYSGSGGGGGYYGGGSNNNVVCNASGGGGSGYIGGVSNGSMTSGVRTGHGYATITLYSVP